MIVEAVKTKKVIADDCDIFSLLDGYLPQIKEKSVVAITSKVLSICEGRIVPIDSADKKRLVERESDYFLPRTISKFDFTITKNTLIPAAGIDESNAGGNYVLWPQNPQNSANKIRKYLCGRFKLSKLGVIVTDSTCIPLHWGTIGISIGFSGFLPNNSYIGKPDLFGRPFEVSKFNVADSLATTAVAVMGEGAEQTPLAVMEDLPFVDFKNRSPSKKELEAFYIDHLEDDLFAPFLGNVNWRRGGRTK